MVKSVDKVKLNEIMANLTRSLLKGQYSYRMKEWYA
jgi:hypothetical protein